MATHGGNKATVLSEDIHGIDLVCEADNFRLDQVFRNLFDNALAACSEPIRVEIACTDASLNGRPALRIAVRDNGPGLMPADRQRVFVPFSRPSERGRDSAWRSSSGSSKPTAARLPLAS